MADIDFSLADAVKKEEFFSALSDSDLQAVLQALTKQTLSKGDTLIKQGEKQTRMFIAETGRIVKERADGQKISLKNGEISGLLHFFQQDPSAATLSADEESSVWVLDSNTFHKLLKEHHTLNESFIAFLTRQVRKQCNTLNQVRTRLSPHKGVSIAFFDSKEYMRAAFEKVNKDKGFNFHFEWFKEKLNKDTAVLASGTTVACCFVNDDVGTDAVSALHDNGVEMVAMRCAGFDNVDLPKVKELQMSVTRVPAYSPYAVAEFAVTLMLTLNRKIHKAYNRVREHNFSLNNLVGFDMRGKTVGVLGTGKIGKCTIDILLGFGCKCICYDVYEDPEIKAKPGTLIGYSNLYRSARLIRDPADICKYVTKDELFEKSDIITLHAPLLPGTKHVLNKAAFDRMKKGVMVINTSRGGLVDSEALLEAVMSGKVGSAGLDVYEGEKEYFFENKSAQNIKDTVLARLIASPNVVVSSHQAFLTQEALFNIAESTLNSVKEFVGGKKGDQLTNAIKG